MSITHVLIQQLEEAYHTQAWHGANLRGAIRGLTLEQVCWRPSPKRHNIWEIVVHCAYWKYAVLRRITGKQRGSFPLKGSNWFVRPIDKSEKAWKHDVQLLDDMHYQLVSAVKTLPPSHLHKKTAKKKFTHVQTIVGIAMHDVYHTGQIQLLKRLQQ